MDDAIGSALVLLLHLGFVLFVVFGAALVARRPRLMWLHLPAAAWGFFVELTGRACPLTGLENVLRARAGLDGYTQGFVEHYLLWLLYPDGLTRDAQILLAAGVVVVNIALYAWVFLVHKRRRRVSQPPAAA